MLEDIFNWLTTKKRQRELKKHYHVSWDKEVVFIKSQDPLLLQTNNSSFRWNNVERVCLEITRQRYSDELYIFTSCRLDAFIIPLDAKGGPEFMNTIIAKRLFDQNYITTKKYNNVGQYWWPEQAA